jgi:uncharacterized protein YcfJ
MSRTTKLVVVLACASFVIPSAGCQSKAGTGAVAGGIGGAVIGGVIGNNRGSGNAASGAAIGGAIGAIGGGLAGHGMDKADEKKKQEQREREEAAARQRQQQQQTYNSTSSSTYAAPAPAPAVKPAAPTSTLTRGDVVDWTRQGVSDAIIIDRIQRSGQQFIITAADERELKSLGVHDPVVTAMKNTSR